MSTRKNLRILLNFLGNGMENSVIEQPSVLASRELTLSVALASGVLERLDSDRNFCKFRYGADVARLANSTGG